MIESMAGNEVSQAETSFNQPESNTNLDLDKPLDFSDDGQGIDTANSESSDFDKPMDFSDDGEIENSQENSKYNFDDAIDFSEPKADTTETDGNKESEGQIHEDPIAEENKPKDVSENNLDTEQPYNDQEKNNELQNDSETADQKGEPIKNKQDGLRRENEVYEDLNKTYPENQGYEVVSECYLRNENGEIVLDPDTGEARRVDFMVVKDGVVVDSVEVTSKTADKTNQIAKEERIRENGGNYIKDGNGNLCKIPDDLHTRIERRN